jgi:hypothetical protein
MYEVESTMSLNANSHFSLTSHHYYDEEPQYADKDLYSYTIADSYEVTHTGNIQMTDGLTTPANTIDYSQSGASLAASVEGSVVGSVQGSLEGSVQASLEGSVVGSVVGIGMGMGMALKDAFMSLGEDEGGFVEDERTRLEDGEVVDASVGGDVGGGKGMQPAGQALSTKVEGVDLEGQENNELEVEVEVMPGAEACGEDLLTLVEVPDVGAGVLLAHITIARLIERAEVFGVGGVADGEGAAAGEAVAVAAVSGGQDAVEHIDAAGDVLDEVLGLADAHHVAGLVSGHEASG